MCCSLFNHLAALSSLEQTIFVDWFCSFEKELYLTVDVCLLGIAFFKSVVIEHIYFRKIMFHIDVPCKIVKCDSLLS